MDTLLEVRDLIVKAEENTILDVPCLSILPGEVLVLLGPNGAGKSTLLHVAAGLRKPTSGSVYFSQQPKLSDLEYRRKVSTVFQSPLLITETVEHNIASGLNFRGISREQTHNRVNYWMDLFHISHLAKRQAKVLSGGEAQRVSLARAFCLETELILMDEPFGALDSPTRQELLDDLRQILSKTNQTCIYVTHDLDEALAIGDRVAIFFNGKLHQLDTTWKVFASPATAEVAVFTGIENIIPGSVVKKSDGLLQIKAENATIEAVGEFEIGTTVYVCLRPEDITLYNVEEEIKSSSARNQIAGRITKIINQGPFQRIQFDSGFPLTALVTRPSAMEMNLVNGKEIRAVFKASAIHLIATNK